MRTKFLARLALAATLCLVLGLATTASATPIEVSAISGIHVGNEFVAFEPVQGAANKFTATFGGVTAQFTAFTALGDPSINWSVDATNATGGFQNITAVFAFIPGEAFATTQLHSSAGVSLTDGAPNSASASLVPFQFVGLPPNNNLIVNNYTIDPAGVVGNQWGIVPAFVPAITNGGTRTTDDEIFALGGGVGVGDTFAEIVSFTISPFDTTGLSGTCDYVPIPPTLILFGSGMLGMGLLGWRRRLSS